VAKKTKKDDPKKKVEERFVECSDLDAGVKLKAGHPVRLLLKCDGGSVTPAPTPAPTPTPATTTTRAPATTTTQSTTPAPTPGTTPSTTTTAAPTTSSTKPAAPTPAPTPIPSTSTRPPTTTTRPVRATRITEFGSEHFETAKSFPLPSPAALQTFRDIVALVQAEPDRQLLILGHTDTQANDDYNMALSRERAAAIQAYLTNDVSAWYQFYSHSDLQKRWGTREDQLMLNALPDGQKPYYGVVAYNRNSVDGKSGPSTRKALQDFQKAANLSQQDGDADEPTRRALILAFMQIEGTSIAPSTKIVSKGCGYHNMIVKTTIKPQVNEPRNRRVEVYAFPGPITPDASAWDSDRDGTWASWQSGATPIDGAEKAQS